MKAKPKYQLITIGDCATDAFINLHNASVHCDLNHKNCMLCVSFADKVPYESLEVIPAVGNPSNVAVGAARLGLRVAILTAVGDDFYGRQILEVYRKEKVSRELVKVNNRAQTNYHFVLTFQAERTILVKHNRFQYRDPVTIDRVPWVYFSSLADHTLPFHNRLAKYLREHSEIKMGFNPNTFQLKMGAKNLKNIYRQTHVLFVNREEAQKILKIQNTNVKVLFRGLHKLGPKIVVITDGPAGAYASDGQDQYYMPIYPDPKPPAERTGAGDAFATGFMAGLIAGLPMREVLRWAPINPMSVVQYTGAQKGLLTKRQLLRLLSNAPKHYYPKKF